MCKQFNLKSICKQRSTTYLKFIWILAYGGDGTRLNQLEFWSIFFFFFRFQRENEQTGTKQTVCVCVCEHRSAIQSSWDASRKIAILTISFENEICIHFTIFPRWFEPSTLNHPLLFTIHDGWLPLACSNLLPLIFRLLFFIISYFSLLWMRLLLLLLLLLFWLYIHNPKLHDISYQWLIA